VNPCRLVLSSSCSLVEVGEAILSDLPACLPAGKPAGRLDDFKFFFGRKLS
jgi:hypothetical protein